MSKAVSPLRDDELVRMLADEPELLALADALVLTHRKQHAPAEGTRRWKSLLVVAAVTAALAGSGVAIASSLGAFSTAPVYSVQQVEQAFADQGIQLQDVTPARFGSDLVVLNGRPDHAVTVYVEYGKYSGTIWGSLFNLEEQRQGNLDVQWLPEEDAAVHAALQELTQTG